jgi:molybdate transport system ATP-binding protein
VPAPDSPTLFSLTQLGLSYRARPVLRGIDWNWRNGEQWAVLGPNGAGKTSLAGILSGEQLHFSGSFERSSELRAGGTAYVCFERGRRLCERDAKLDCSEYESSARDPGTRVRDLLKVGNAGQHAWERIVELLSLESILDRGLRFVSTGEMRKALLGSALLSQPSLLILDSPLDGLDRATQRRLAASLNDIIEELPAVLVLCRSRDEVPEACSNLLLLDRGRVLERGARDALLCGDTARQLLAVPTLDFQAPPAPATRDLAARPARPATLELDNVTVNYGDFCVFRNLRWRMDPHQHCLIAGPNGSGKSTLLDLLTGDNHKAFTQQVRLFGALRGSGESVWDIKAHFGRVDARMQQAVPPGSRVLEVVVSGFYDSLGLRDRPSDGQARQARAWLAALGLATLASEEFHTLSFGLQRLVLLGRAMVKGPSILLLDEATLGLDAGHRRLLLAAVDHVVARGHCQLLFVSHTKGEVPACINQSLEFIPEEGGSRVVVDAYPPTPRN